MYLGADIVEKIDDRLSLTTNVFGFTLVFVAIIILKLYLGADIVEDVDDDEEENDEKRHSSRYHLQANKLGN